MQPTPHHRPAAPLSPARVVAALLALALAGCATPTAPSEPGVSTLEHSRWARACRMDGATAPDWNHQVFGNRTPTEYEAVTHQGRPALHARSRSGHSAMRLRMAEARPVAAQRLAFSWYVPALNLEADLRDKDADDAVVRVMLSFDGDRSRMSRRDHMLSELSHLVTGEPMPYATLMYVWDHRYPVGSVIPNPNTPRIRKLVVENGPQRLNHWLDYERDIEADFRLAFGEAPGPLIGVGLMTDANNTGQSVAAWYGPLRLTATPADAAAPLRTSKPDRP